MIKLKIEGMTCGHCVKHVTEALSKVPGVQNVVGVSLNEKLAFVSGDPKPAALVESVADAGYEAQVV